MDEEIVISGFSGKYPNSRNVREFWDKLLKGEELFDGSETRWPKDFGNLPVLSGKVLELEKFDADFFNVSLSEANLMDSQFRQLLEVVYESIWDSGIDPAELRGTRTALFVGTIAMDMITGLRENDKSVPKLQLSLIGQLSSFFDLRGPSMIIDTACASSFSGFHEAVVGIEKGLFDKAIVCGSAHNLRPTTSKCFSLLNMLCKEGKCLCMDANANGYCRSEAVVSILIQKAKDAKRIYASILTSGTNSDGWKKEGITFPSKESQTALMRSVFEKKGINPLDINYAEAHMTGTSAGDPIESGSLLAALRGDHNLKPLKLGCLKSNMGHTEGVSGLCAISKVLLAFQNKTLPPNINFKVPNPGIEGLLNGRLVPVLKAEPFDEDLVAVNSFGFGGSNVHTVLKGNPKRASALSYQITDPDLCPIRLVQFAGRTSEAVNTAFDHLSANPGEISREFLALINDLCKMSPISSGLKHRGYALLNGEDKKVTIRASQEVQSVPVPVWLLFSGHESAVKGGSKFPKKLQGLGPIVQSLRKLNPILKKALNNTNGLDLLDLVFNTRSSKWTNDEDSSIAAGALQMAIVDLLKSLGITADGIIGQAEGEISAAYLSGALSATEAIGVLVSLTKAKNESDKLSLIKKLESSIKESKAKTPRWISTTALNESNRLNTQLSSSVAFRNAVAQIPDDAIILTIGSDSVLDSNLKPNALRINLLPKSSSNPIQDVLSAIGQLYMSGSANPSIEVLYPQVSYPVPRETPSLSHLFRWDHSKSYAVTKYPEYFNNKVRNTAIDLSEGENSFLEGHCIDGRILFPATGYLHLIWNKFAERINRKQNELCVSITNVQFHRATTMTKGMTVEFCVEIEPETGLFTISESNSICVSGTIKEATPMVSSSDHVHLEPSPDAYLLNSKQIYKELRVRGYDYGRTFQCVTEQTSDAVNAKIKWTGQWIAFSDNMLHVSIFGNDLRMLRLPTFIQSIYVDPKVFYEQAETAADSQLRVSYDRYSNIISTAGLIIKGLEASPVARRPNAQRMSNFSQQFTPFNDANGLLLSTEQSHELERYLKLCLDQLAQRGQSTKMTKAEFKKYLESGKDEYSLLRTLKEIQSEFDLSKVNANLSQDQLLTGTLTQIYETQLSLIVQNMETPEFEYFELNQTNRPLDKEFLESMKYTYLKPNYTLVKGLKCESGANAEADQVLDWTTECVSLPKEVTNANAIVLKDWTTDVITGQDQLQSSVNYNADSVYTSIYNALKPGGFFLLILRPQLSPIEEHLIQLSKASKPNLQSLEQATQIGTSIGFLPIATKSTSSSSLTSVLFKKPSADRSSVLGPQDTVIEVTTMDYSWVEPLKVKLAENETSKIWLVARDCEENGIVGLVNCLRKETNGTRIRCVYNPNGNSTKPIADCVTSDILDKDLAFNVTINGVDGYYSSLSTDLFESSVATKYAHIDVKTVGDLSSLGWFDATSKIKAKLLAGKNQANTRLCQMYYSALNFKDVMVASGRVPLSAYPPSYLNKCLIGMEYAGLDENGNRVMGFCKSEAIATSFVLTDDECVNFRVPNNWSLEDAATVPVVYFTVYYALLVRGALQKNEKVLIHAGSGGVGIAAISVCLAMGCEVFTTVGTEKKRSFLKSKFPALQDEHFANSRDMSFEEHIMKQTNGQGVDVILNSLAEEKLRGTMKCLAPNGRFVEIGKYDLIQNNTLDLSMLGKNQSFQVVCVAHLQDDALRNKSKSAIQIVKRVSQLLTDGIANGEVIPLQRDVFDRTEIEEAFRFMANGKHIGKVLIKIRDETAKTGGVGGDEMSKAVTVSAFPQSYCQPNKTYLIVGGLGGFGLELALWLESKGAKKIVLTSRSGITNSYQRFVVNQMRSNGLRVEISQESAADEQSADRLVSFAEKIGPIGGIFNLAMVLRDALFENQTVELFKEACEPKINTSIHLDRVTRSRCKEIDYFVCFSSIASGVGNPGQSNYAFANCVMERVCEKRRRDGAHGLAIQWGPIGDVGVVAEIMGGNDVNIAGYSPQRMPSCFFALNQLLQSPFHICSSIIKAAETKAGGGGGSSSGDLLKTICHVMGIKDPASIQATATLGDLGLDSLMGVEIKQTLEREYSSVLTAADIRNLTVEDIKKISTQKVDRSGESGSDGGAGGKAENAQKTLEQLICPTELFTEFNTNMGGKPVFLLPPIEGDYTLLKKLFQYIPRPIVGINWTVECDQFKSIQDLAAFYLKKIRSNYEDSDYDLIGYSFGGVVALQLAIQMQKSLGKRSVSKLILLDSSPDYIRSQIRAIKTKFNREDDQLFKNYAIVNYLSLICPIKGADDLERQFSATDSLEKRKEIIKATVAESCLEIDSDLLLAAGERYVMKFQMLDDKVCKENDERFEGKLNLIRASESIENSSEVSDKDYGLQKMVNGKVDTLKLTGDHQSFISNNLSQIGDFLDSELLKCFG